ncbi:MAG TPA: hypothetical protein VGM39_08765 [Kofleriaceae bacterium]|jgi:hypothetical protein
MSLLYLYPRLLGFFMIPAFFGAAVAGYKNRSMFWWSIGCLFVPPIFAVLAFMPKLAEPVPAAAAPTRPVLQPLPSTGGGPSNLQSSSQVA